MPCMLQGFFLQCASSSQKYCSKYVMKCVCELMNLYSHGGNKTTWSKWRYIVSREVAFCKVLLPMEKECPFCLRDAAPFEWKRLFVKPALINENWFFERSMHAWLSLVDMCSVLTAFSGLGKDPKLTDFVHAGWITTLRETLQRGGGTSRYTNYTSNMIWKGQELSRPRSPRTS